MGIVQKGWGCEEIWASNEHYCGKFLHFNKGGESSMHFHMDKLESWYVLSGYFYLEQIDLETGELSSREIGKGDIINLYPMMPHRLKCAEEGTICEVSTQDNFADNYRVMPGDSQR